MSTIACSVLGCQLVSAGGGIKANVIGRCREFREEVCIAASMGLKIEDWENGVEYS